MLLVFLAGYRLLLTQSGHLYWPDEYRYLHALHFLDEIRKGDPTSAFGWVFGDVATRGGVASQPTYIMVSIVPAVVQGLANVVFGIQPEDPSFYRIPGAANVLVSLALTVMFYLVLWRLTADRGLALLGTFVYALLANTNVYVRHLFPYDLALLLFLSALVLLLDDPRTAGLSARINVVIVGVLAGAAMTTYPGYNFFVIILFALILAKHWTEWKRAAGFLAGIASVFVGWEIVSRAGGFSFLESLRQFSRMYNPGTVQGSTSESFSFLLLYLWNVEGAAGAVLLALFLCFLGMAVAGKFGRLETALIASASVAFLAFATFSVISNRVAIYGRLLHMYLPFLVIGSIVVIRQLHGPVVRRVAVAVLALASVVSFVPTAVNAFAIRFPRDVERELRVLHSGNPMICDIARSGGGPEGERSYRCDLIVENVRHLYPLPSVLESAPPSGFELSRAYRHPLQFTPYWFEGFAPDERVRLREYPLVMRVYAKAGSAFHSGEELRLQNLDD